MLALDGRLLLKRLADLRRQVAEVEQQILSIRGYRCSRCYNMKEPDEYGTCARCREWFRDAYAQRKAESSTAMRLSKAA